MAVLCTTGCFVVYVQGNYGSDDRNDTLQFVSSVHSLEVPYHDLRILFRSSVAISSHNFSDPV